MAMKEKGGNGRGQKAKESWVWWCTPVILSLKKLRQEDHRV
jgi:hypothetical protein